MEPRHLGGPAQGPGKNASADVTNLAQRRGGDPGEGDHAAGHDHHYNNNDYEDVTPQLAHDELNAPRTTRDRT